MCALPRPLNPTTATLTVLFWLGRALALSAAGNATELMRKCLRLTSVMISPLPVRGRRRRLRVLSVQFRDAGGRQAGMYDDAIAEPRMAAGFDRQAAILRLIVEEIAHAERIDRVQPVPPRVPVRRVPRIAGVIHHDDADRFSVDLA